MRRLVYMAALALVAMVVLAPGAIAQQMNGEHMMPNGQMMDDSQMMGANNNMMASPSASASASTSASASPSASAYSSGSATPTATASAPRSHHHHGGGGSSTSAVVGGRLPSTGGVPLVSLVSVGALALLLGSGLVAARLLRRSS
jgi:hypothetical protein